MVQWLCADTVRPYWRAQIPYSCRANCIIFLFSPLFLTSIGTSISSYLALYLNVLVVRKPQGIHIDSWASAALAAPYQFVGSPCSQLDNMHVLHLSIKKTQSPFTLCLQASLNQWQRSRHQGISKCSIKTDKSPFMKQLLCCTNHTVSSPSKSSPPWKKSSPQFYPRDSKG